MTTDTEQLTLAWWLKRKTETTVGVDLQFERAFWWTGDYEETLEDVEPGTPGAGTDHDPDEGTMTVRLTSDAAKRFEVGRQYTFVSTVEPLYEGD
jgi:hypothetical protein